MSGIKSTKKTFQVDRVLSNQLSSWRPKSCQFIENNYFTASVSSRHHFVVLWSDFGEIHRERCTAAPDTFPTKPTPQSNKKTLVASCINPSSAVSSSQLSYISKWFIIAILSLSVFSCCRKACSCRAFFLLPPPLPQPRITAPTKVSDVIRCEIDMKWSVALCRARRMTKYLNYERKMENSIFDSPSHLRESSRSFAG